jgi:hypothetical protein
MNADRGKNLAALLRRSRLLQKIAVVAKNEDSAAPYTIEPPETGAEQI